MGRRPSEGTIERRKGKTGVSYRLSYYTPEGLRKKGPWRPTRQAAREAARSERDDRSFHTAAKALLPSLRVAKTGRPLAPTNQEQYELTVAAIEDTALGRAQLHEIDSELVWDWANSNWPKSPTTRFGQVTRVKAILKRLGHQPEIPNPKPPRRRKTYMPPDQLQEFLEHVATLSELDQVLLLVFARGGLRRSEGVALRHEKVDGDGAWIEAAITRTGGADHERQILKTDNSFAWQPLPPELLKLIGPPRTGYVLTGTDQPMRPDAALRRVKVLLTGTKWEGLNIQALRRSYGQWYWQSTGNLLGAATLMRHTVEMAEREYLQTDKDVRRDLLKAAAKSKRRSKTA